jgi:hypothetical protein
MGPRRHDASCTVGWDVGMHETQVADRVTIATGGIAKRSAAMQRKP